MFKYFSKTKSKETTINSDTSEQKNKQTGYFNSLSNRFTNSSEQFGDVHMISLWGSILSRLAYNEDKVFIENYCKITDNILYKTILNGINTACIPGNNLIDILDDEKIFGLSDPDSIFKGNYTYIYNNKKYINFTELEIPQDVNIINGEIKAKDIHKVDNFYDPINECDVKYISICTSNYSEIYVVADKRSPNIIYLIFRGTNSAKSAMSYTRPSSIVPYSACKSSDDSFLKGIFKITIEIMHTIIESIRYLSQKFLNASEPNSITIFTTGHSLGGAMSTIFSYLWKSCKEMAPYNSEPYNILSSKIICISLGAPRCLGANTAHKFCNKTQSGTGDIIFLRITTKGDPVPALPPKTGFQHPCSSSEDITKREEISEDCTSLLTARGSLSVHYKGNLNCVNKKTRPYVPNMLSHMIYLDILYSKVIDFKKILSNEIKRDKGSTVCRIIVGERNTDASLIFNAIFFNLSYARDSKYDNTINDTSIVSEDVKITDLIFNELMNRVFKVRDISNMPLSPPEIIERNVDMQLKIEKRFNFALINNNKNIMPTFGCVSLNNTQMGGIKRKRKTKRLQKKKRCKKYTIKY